MPLRQARFLVERVNGNEVSVRNSGLEAGASVWRVTWDGAKAHATRALAPAVGEGIIIQRTLHGGVDDVRAAIRQDLADRGLTRHEAAAFMRAWDSALFGADGSISAEEDTDVEDGIPADIPVQAIDTLTADDETVLDGEIAEGAPRISDTILYWLPSTNIEAMAELSFRPAPQEVHRTILVRVDAR